MQTVILLAYTLIAAAPNGSSHTRYYDWRELSRFESAAACEKAIQNLGLTKIGRCIDSTTGEIVGGTR